MQGPCVKTYAMRGPSLHTTITKYHRVDTKIWALKMAKKWEFLEAKKWPKIGTSGPNLALFSQYFFFTLLDIKIQFWA